MQCGLTKIFGLVVVDVVLNAQRLVVSPIGGIVSRKIPASLERGTIIVRLYHERFRLKVYRTAACGL